MLQGKTFSECCGMAWTDAKGQQASYSLSDLQYDLKCGYINYDMPNDRVIECLD